MANSNEIEVAVIGGGVCGLTCTIALRRAGIRVQLFEAAPAFGEIGAGIGLGPNAVEVMQNLGLMDEILKKVDHAELRDRGFAFYHGLEDSDVPIFKYNSKAEEKGLGLHRAVFLDALVGALDPGIAHFNKRCTSIAQSAGNPKRLAVNFTDGSMHEADVVLGADGVKSAVRNFVLGESDMRMAYSNTVAYRGLIPYAKLKAAGFRYNVLEHPTCVCGPSKHMILFPIKNGEIINVVAFSARYGIPIGSANLADGIPWVEEVPKDVLLEEYEEWGPDATALLTCMPERPSKWSIHVVYPALETYAKGHVALLGDAAHAMLPHLGAGAGQGLEDAYVLTRLLSHPETNTDNLEAVLAEYSRIRQPRAQMVWERSRWAGSVYDFHGPRGHSPEAIREELQTMYDAIWNHDLEADIEAAIQSLRRTGAFVPSPDSTHC